MRKTPFIAALFAASVGLGSPAFADAAAGARLFKAKCASCHGADGKAQTAQGTKQKVRDMTTPAWQREFSDEQLVQATRDGLKRTTGGVKQDMPAYGAKLAPAQVQDLVAYMRSLK